MGIATITARGNIVSESADLVMAKDHRMFRRCGTRQQARACHRRRVTFKQCTAATSRSMAHTKVKVLVCLCFFRTFCVFFILEDQF